MKPYVINFSPLALPQHEVLNYFNTRPEIQNWYTPFVGTVVAVSNYSPVQLSNIMAERFPEHHFLVTEAGVHHVDGRLPNTAWDFINHPKPSGRWGNMPISNAGVSGLASIGWTNATPKN